MKGARPAARVLATLVFLTRATAWRRLCCSCRSGEDPTLNGEYGAQFITGFQGVNSTTTDAPLRSSSCAKHYFAYSLENCYTQGDNCRLNFNAQTTQQDIEDTYLPAFQSAVERGGVSGLMCSYNAINGVPGAP